MNTIPLRFTRLAAALTICLTGSAFLPSSGVADPGDLDPTFGPNGKVATYLGRPSAATSVALQPDGKVIAAGRRATVRYLKDGRIDRDFGFKGEAQPGVAIALQPDGKIVETVANSVIRLNQDGRIDYSFGGDGVAQAPVLAFFRAVVVQPDGDVLAGGTSEEGFVLTRFTPDGELDRTFGEGGVVTTDLSGAAPPCTDSIQSVVFAPSGRIIAAGTSGVPFANNSSGCAQAPRAAVVAYLPDGELDPSFGSGGIFTTSATASADGIALRGGGRVVFAGPADSFRVVGLRANGQFDPKFGGGDGITGARFPEHKGVARAVAVQPSGRIVAVGFTRATRRRQHRFALARFFRDGRLDLEFGHRGTVTTAVGDSSDAYALAVTRRRIIVAGVAHDLPNSPGRLRIALARYFGGL